jgi:hypothetical protein
MKKNLLLLSVALIAFAPSAFATQDNSAAISGSNNDLIQQTGTGNVLATGSGAFGTNNAGGAGGNATATGGTGGNATGGSVIGSGNSSNVNTALGGAGGQGGRGGDGGTGIGLGGVGIGGDSAAVGVGGSQSQSATTGNQSINVEAQKRAAATAYAAPLVTGYECNGSTSAGFQAPGIGISVGGTRPSAVCEAVFLSRELERKGKLKASLGVLCENEEVRRNMRFEDEGCPQDTAGAGAVAVASSASEWRDRSGYPASGNTSKH